MNRSTLLLFSIFIRNRNAFLVLVGLAAALKLVLSAVEPASFDLRGIIMLVASGNAPIGPWLVLYPPLYRVTSSNMTQLQSWSLTAPSGITLLSLLFRLPVFLLDLATLAVLVCIGSKMRSPRDGRLMGLIWFLNPFSFLAVECLGLPDILCILLVTLSYFFLISDRTLLSAGALGLGAFVKFFPILLLPPLLMYVHLKGVGRRLLLSASIVGVVGFLGYLAWVLPYGLQYIVTSTPVTQLMPFVGGAPNTVSPVTFGLFTFYCLMLIFMKKTTPLPVFLSTLLVYYLLSAAVPAPQYLIWLLPLIAVDVVLADRLGVLIISSLLAFAFVQWFLVSSAFLTPSGYSLLMFPLGGANLPSYSVAVGNFLDSYLIDLLILPLVSSATFALILAYAVEQIRTWFSAPKVK